MIVRYCNVCGVPIGPYEIWRLTLQFTNDPAPPVEPRHAGDICGDCVKPALELVTRAQEAT